MILRVFKEKVLLVKPNTSIACDGEMVIKGEHVDRTRTKAARSYCTYLS